MSGLRKRKYWPPVGRIDSVYGDRNVFCSCPPVADSDRLRVPPAVEPLTALLIAMVPPAPPAAPNVPAPPAPPISLALTVTVAASGLEPFALAVAAPPLAAVRP